MGQISEQIALRRNYMEQFYIELCFKNNATHGKAMNQNICETGNYEND